VTLRDTEQRVQKKAAWLLKKAKKYRRALKKVGAY
jgi:3-methyladenine DNA glycosylase AlkD